MWKGIRNNPKKGDTRQPYLGDQIWEGVFSVFSAYLKNYGRYWKNLETKNDRRSIWYKKCVLTFSNPTHLYGVERVAFSDPMTLHACKLQVSVHRCAPMVLHSVIGKLALQPYRCVGRENVKTHFLCQIERQSFFVPRFFQYPMVFEIYRKN